MSTVTVLYHQQVLKAKDEQHQREIRVLENKIQRFKQAADDRRKELFEELNRGERLAKSLGFTGIHDAQCAIDTVDHDITFVECYNELHRLEVELDAAKKEEEIWRLKASQLEQENSTLHAQIKELRLLKDKLTDELQDLSKRYDGLVETKKRASERYKADYQKWRSFQAWLYQSDDACKEENLTPDERMKRKNASSNTKRAIFRKLGPDVAPPPGVFTSPPPPFGGTALVEDDEDVTPKKGETESVIKGASLQSVLRPIGNITPESSSMVKKFTIPHDSVAYSIEASNIKQEPASSPMAMRGSQPKNDGVHGSSDTEDDSQDLPVSSPSLPPRPPQTRLPPPRIRREPSTIASPMRHSRPQTERPAKIRRLSIDGSPQRTKLPASTPRNVSGPSKLRLLRSEGAPALSSTDREQEMEVTPLARTAGQKRMDDYSAFKGRGRYGKSASTNADENTTINALFEINPTANAGKAFQFEEVVRNKEQRKKLQGGDCECCRDYYDSVGPLPERQQQPLWRSPSKTPQRPCIRHTKPSHFHDENEGSQLEAPSSSRRDVLDTASHKKQISRHRYAWERAKTPPGFWDIGFPNTQEVKDINERAKDIHEKKREAIDREAASGSGRYRRK
ncbi:hypothetical protein CVT24_010748 [Panaeolus cyanescens]|uniref:DNA endonuclease activator Ctp1 C-terminal domain-containing protein n=1 Tax=Panaeolus cyanescens TaxID=181874 RepID=A0A409YME3_9AGAR|nr:hypothetical protein CVT24_010748 [Panaeolus cyanescens]